jgi:cephalosporin-C deacetylase
MGRGKAVDHVTSVEKPDDFDDFWADLLARAAATPLDEQVEPVPLRSNDQVETYEIHYNSIDGVRIAGWYCRPAERHLPPPYPALLIVPGYISEPTLPKSWARMGYAAVGVAPRGKLRSNAQFNPGYPGLLTHNIVDRETYSYRGFYIDAARAVDFVLTRPEIDHSRIGVHGSSQGGALTITTAALRNDAITCGAAGAPYLTGFMDSASLTHSSPYEEMNEYLRLYPDREAAMRRTVAYFDCVNFAPMIKAPMLVYAGLGDDVCPPETAFDLVNAMPGPVEFLTSPRCAHDAGIYWHQSRVESFLAEHLRPTKVGVSR